MYKNTTHCDLDNLSRVNMCKIQLFDRALKVEILCSIVFSLLAFFPNNANSNIASEPEFKIYRYKQFRIGYIHDKNNPLYLTDINTNGIPDSIEDVATQLYAAHAVLVDHYKFIDPMKSNRNYLFVEPSFIDVELFYDKTELRKFSNSKQSKTMKERYDDARQLDFSQNDDVVLAGSAVNFASQSEFDPEVHSLKINLFADQRARNSGVAVHEYFHLIQMGYAYFKNLWFIEGTAEWAEDVVADRKSTYKSVDIEQYLLDDSKLQTLRNSAYSSSNNLFKPLIVACNDAEVVPDSIVNNFQYVDGTSVFADNLLYGVRTMKALFECVNQKENEILDKAGGFVEWVSNTGPLSEKNDPYILECVYDIYLSCIEE